LITLTLLNFKSVSDIMKHPVYGVKG
jgi:hypothetical protein